MKYKYKSIFISDIHLGVTDWQIDVLNKFLKNNPAKNIFLVGDIFDLWKLKRKIFWPKSYNKLLKTILKLSKTCNIYYICGNHDEYLREFIGEDFGGIKILDEYQYETVLGKKALVIHGDKFDTIINKYKILSHLGAMGYEVMLGLNKLFSYFRRKLGYTNYWSLSSFVKEKVKSAASYINSYEQVLVDYAKLQEVDIIFCGHIHKNEIKYIDDILYCNCGDFVESMTLIVEKNDGEIKTIEFKKYEKEI